MKNIRGALLVVLSLVMVMHAGAQSGAARAKRDFPSPNAPAAAVQQFAGTWSGTYSSNVVKPTAVALIFQQRGNTVTGTYLSANGAQGVMYGTSSPTGLQASARQTTPTCIGQFDMLAQAGASMTWTFKGTDCLGIENGKGTATKK